MRLLLLPISTRRALIYCEPPASAAVQGSTGQKQSYLDWGVNKASTTWADWEKAPKGWKHMLTQYGNKALRRIPFEEWGLKSIPALKESRRKEIEALLQDRDTQGRTSNNGARDSFRSSMVEIRFPGMFQSLGKKSVMQILQETATDRQSLHKRRLYWSLGIAPFTLPFALIPVIPNIPFFYLMYRAFSHWRALGGSRHLEFLVENNLLNLSPSKTLDSLYTTGLLHTSPEEGRQATDPTENQTKQVVELIQRQLEGSSTTSAPSASPQSSTIASTSAGDSSSSANTSKRVEDSPPIMTAKGKTQLSHDTPQPAEPEEIMLLRIWNGKLMAERLGLPGLEVEIERAVEQVERDLKKQKEGKSEVSQTTEEVTESIKEKVKQS